MRKLSPHIREALIALGSLAVVLGVLVALGSAAQSMPLVLVQNGRDVGPLTAEMKLESLQDINVRAEAPAKTQSVKFSVNGKTARVENVSPYYLFGDIDGVPNSGSFEDGQTVEITAVAYNRKGGKGSKIASGNQKVKFVLKVPGPDPEPDPDPDPDPEPSPGPGLRQPVGYYVMQEVGAQNVSDAKLSSSKFVGFVLRERWRNCNPAPGQYDWSFTDAQFRRAERLNRQVILSIYTGSNAPPWIPGAKFGGDRPAPLPWSNDMLTAYEALQREAGKRYGNHPLLVGVEIGGATCPDTSNEMHPNGGVERQPGYSLNAMTNAWIRCGRACAESFPSVAIISDGGPNPAGGRADVTLALWDYMHSTYGQRFNASHCALAAKTPENALHHRIVVEHKKRGGRIGFEMIGPSLGGINGEKGPVSRFGGKFSTAIALGEKAGASWYKPYQGDEREIK